MVFSKDSRLGVHPIDQNAIDSETVNSTHDEIRKVVLNFEKLLDSTSDGLLVLDSSLTCLYINEVAAHIMGSTKECISGKNISNTMIHWPEFLDLLKIRFDLAFASNKCHRFADNLKRRAQPFVCESEFSPLIDNSGNTFAVSILFRDVTERERSNYLAQIQKDIAITASHSSNLDAILRLALEHAIKIGEMDCGGIYQEDPDGSFRLTIHRGLSPAFIKSMSVLRPDSPAAHAIIHGNRVFTRFPSVPIQKDEHRLGEGLRALGVVPIMYNGKAIAVIAVASHERDEISPFAQMAVELIGSQVGMAIAQAKVELQQKESEEKYRNIVEHSPDGIALIDEEGRIVEWNSGIESITGMKREEVLGKMLWDVLSDVIPPEPLTPERREVLLAQLQQTLNTGIFSGPSIPFEVIIKYNEGAHKIIRLIPSIIRTNKGFIMSTIARDVTSEKRALETLEKLFHEAIESAKMRANLVTFASHELKTPLIPIVGWTDVIRTAKRRGKSLDSLLSIEDIESFANAANRLEKIIDDFLDMGRIQGNRLGLRPEATRLRSMLDNAISNVSAFAQSRNIQIYQNATDQDLCVDSFRIEQVFINILSNAIKNSPPGKAVKITSETINDAVTIKFADEGVGFTPAQLETVWIPFSKPYTTKKEGIIPPSTGIGLYISKGIIEQHGGIIEITSPGSNAGATVTISLPLKP